MLLPNGAMLAKAVSATKWKAIQNNAHNNFINYLLIDVNSTALGRKMDQTPRLACPTAGNSAFDWLN
jgi:hypothetical protein